MNATVSRNIREAVGIPLPEHLRAGTLISPDTRFAGKRRGGSKGDLWDADHVELGPLIVGFYPGTSRPDGTSRCPARVADVAVGLRGAGVARVFSLGDHEGLPYALLAPVEGRTLGEILSSRGRLGRDETVDVVCQVGRLLETYHDVGTVHGELGLETVFSPNHPAGALLLIGGGDAEARDASSAPSSSKGAVESAGVDADRRALGVIAYRCLTGEAPSLATQKGEPRQSTSSASSAPLGVVGVGFEAWFSRVFARRERDRFESVREMTESLHEALARHDAAPRSGRSHPALPWLEAPSWSGARSLGGLVVFIVSYALGCWALVVAMRAAP